MSSGESERWDQEMTRWDQAMSSYEAREQEGADVVAEESLPPEIAALVDRARASGYTRRERPRRRGRPPMDPAVIREFIVGLLEDYETDDAVVPSARYADVAESLTESWLKDRGRAIAEARGGS